MQPKPLEGDRVAEVLAFCEAYVDPESFARKLRRHQKLLEFPWPEPAGRCADERKVLVKREKVTLGRGG